MTKTNITKEEGITLQDYIKTTNLALLRFKAQAILLSADGVQTVAIARAVNRQPRTVSEWLKNWHKRRLGSIFTGHAGNTNASKLSKAQLGEIKRVLQSPPSDHGLPKEFWDVPQLKQYVEATFGVVYECDQSYYFLLKFSNLSFKYADTFDHKRDEQLILERMAAIRTEIKPLLHRPDWEVFAVDEVKMQQDAIIRKAWLKKGERTVIKVDRDKQSQSYIGFLNQRTYACHLHEMEWQNSSEVLKACQKFLAEYPDKRICLVWDNAPFHRSKEIRAELKKGGLLERVHLIAMPPYAPDDNPIEHVWNTAKQAVANIQRETFAATKQAFSDYITSRTFNYTFL